MKHPSKTSSKIRIDRLLSNLGYGTRGQIEFAIKNGRLQMGGETVFNPSQSIILDDDTVSKILFDDEHIDQPSPFTIMLHKPLGYTCSHKEDGHLVYDLLPARWRIRKPALSTIGRLDKYTSGQLLFTDDGDLLHRVISPKTNTPKEYEVMVRDDLRGDETALFQSGNFFIDKDDKPLKPAQWVSMGQRSGIMVLSEGRYHQIRRMFEKIGNEVVGLHRTRTGALSLGDLPPAEWRALNKTDIESLFQNQE